MVLLSSFISLLIFCLVLSVAKRGVLKFPTLIVDLSVSPLLIFASHILQLSCLVHIHLGLLCLHYIILLLYPVPPVSLVIFFLMSILPDINIDISAFLWLIFV